jgi:hypothetical protein
VGGIERGLFCATVVKQTASHFAARLGPHQPSGGGGQRLSGETRFRHQRAVLEDRPDFAVWKLDLKNAFNEFSRALLTQRFAEAPLPIRRLLPLLVCALLLLGPSAPLATDFASVEGTQQARAARSGRRCYACGLTPLPRHIFWGGTWWW